MTPTEAKNEQIIRQAYQIAEAKDLKGWVDAFTSEGTFTDESLGVTYRGQELAQTVAVYAKAFPDMHRELWRHDRASEQHRSDRSRASAQRAGQL